MGAAVVTGGAAVVVDVALVVVSIAAVAVVFCVRVIFVTDVPSNGVADGSPAEFVTLDVPLVEFARVVVAGGDVVTGLIVVGSGVVAATAQGKVVSGD